MVTGTLHDFTSVKAVEHGDSDPLDFVFEQCADFFLSFHIVVEIF